MPRVCLRPRTGTASVTDAPLSRRTCALAFLLLLALCTLYAASLGSDANWDLRNYHLYDSFALLHGKFGYDIIPAQVQTFLAPQLDLIGYGLRHFLNGHPALFNAAMSVPSAIIAFLGFLITCRLLPGTLPGRIPLAFLVTVIGATGAAGLPTLATSSSESIPGSLSLGGLVLLLGAADSGRPLRRIGLAGLCLGMAAGFKLTSLPFCVGGAAALLAAPLGSIGRKLRAILVFAALGVLGTALIGAPWWIALASRFHNPVFPFFNQVFHAPAYLPVSMADDRFKPQSLGQALFYPFYWAWSAAPRVTELPMRDPRVAVAFVMVVLAALGTLLRRGRVHRESVMVALFLALSYCLWEKQFSIFRYLAPLEMLTGTSVIMAWRILDGASRRTWLPWIGTLLLGLLCLMTTQYPDWGRAPKGALAVEVGPPQLPADALVILLDGSPMAYVAAFEPPSVRFVGANNNLVSPGQKSGLNEAVAAAIRGARGPLWGLEYPPAQGMDDATLAYYGLHRSGACLPVLSNLDANSLRLCPLARNP